MVLKRSSGLKRGQSRLSSSSSLRSRSSLSGQSSIRRGSKLVSHPKSEGLLFEEEVANLYTQITGLWAYRQPGSGSRWFRPGDVLTPHFLIECKEYARATIVLEWLEGIESHAALCGRTPLLAFRDKEHWRTWGILGTLFVPGPMSAPKRLVRGGEKQITVPADAPDTFLIGFRNREGPEMNLFAVFPLEEVFRNAGLWGPGNHQDPSKIGEM